MAKGKTSIYFCQNCGFESSKWMGQCPGCKEWNTFVEEIVDKTSTKASVKKALEDEDFMVNSKTNAGVYFYKL